MPSSGQSSESHLSFQLRHHGRSKAPVTVRLANLNHLKRIPESTLSDSAFRVGQLKFAEDRIGFPKSTCCPKCKMLILL